MAPDPRPAATVRPVPTVPTQRSHQLEVVLAFEVDDDLSVRLPAAARLAEQRDLPLDLVLVHARDLPASRRFAALDRAVHHVRELHPAVEVRVHGDLDG